MTSGGMRNISGSVCPRITWRIGYHDRTRRSCDDLFRGKYSVASCTNQIAGDRIREREMTSEKVWRVFSCSSYHRHTYKAGVGNCRIWVVFCWRYQKYVRRGYLSWHSGTHSWSSILDLTKFSYQYNTSMRLAQNLLLNLLLLRSCGRVD